MSLRFPNFTPRAYRVSSPRNVPCRNICVRAGPSRSFKYLVSQIATGYRAQLHRRLLPRVRRRVSRFNETRRCKPNRLWRDIGCRLMSRRMQRVFAGRDGSRHKSIVLKVARRWERWETNILVGRNAMMNVARNHLCEAVAIGESLLVCFRADRANSPLALMTIF